MMASALLRHGPGHLATVEAELVDWMDRYGLDSVERLRGSASQDNVTDPVAFERANYLRTLASYQPRRMVR
jgi:dihydroorotate dehydrogenase (fumarate)